MPIYEHICLECNVEWEGTFKMSADVKDITCPNCNETGKAKRLISLPAKGRVELTGHELTAQIKADTKKMRVRASTDENYKASMIGEDAYHQQQTQRSSLENDLVKIGKDAVKAKSTSKSTFKRAKTKKAK